MSISTLTAPPLGTVIAHHVLVAVTRTNPDLWVGLFASPDPSSFHLYVTWSIWHDERRGWAVESGDYCQTLAGAIASYADRGGNLSYGAGE